MIKYLTMLKIKTKNLTNHLTYVLVIIIISSFLTLNAFSQTPDTTSHPIKIQEFSAPYDGIKVTNDLPIYKVNFVNGVLKDQFGNVFNSYMPQSTTPVDNCKCIIGGNVGWKAYYTTFYVVLANDPNQMYLVKSCGKSPLQLNSIQQYNNININNFINHGQIAEGKNGVANKVIAAGEIDVVNGKIVYMDTCSGHYKPNVGSLLAYTSKLDSLNVFALTSNLKSIIDVGYITNAQINSDLIFMKPNTSIIPKRNERSGTGDCYCYTTVFVQSVNKGVTTLTNGLMAYQQGNINVFQNTINAITNKNIKSIEVTNNFGYYEYKVYVVTDLHIYNNSLSFKFTDETGDTYGLSIHVYSYNHGVSYNSKKPNINKITFQ